VEKTWISDSGLGEGRKSNPVLRMKMASMGLCLKKLEGRKKDATGWGQGTSYLALGQILVMFVMPSGACLVKLAIETSTKTLSLG
jgi:hypothetical protein